MTKREIENNLLLDCYIDNKFLYNDDKRCNVVELIIRPQCNQKCEYCYITQHGAEIYPIDTRVDNQTILKNVQMILEYLIQDKKAKITRWELFAGDLFYDDLWFDIMDIFYIYLSESSFQNSLGTNRCEIMIPTNLSFVENDEKIKKFEEYKDKFLKIKCLIFLSYSTDGYYAQNFREKKALPQEWFDKTLAFTGKHCYGVHPMLSYENIDSSIENYDWWIDNLVKNYDVDKLWHPMFMPVRNDGWNDEQIDKYLEFIDHMFEFRFNLFDRDPLQFALHLTERDSAKNTRLPIPQFDLIRLRTTRRNEGSINCQVSHTLIINCQTKEIVPCHRLAYPHMAGGKFIEQNEKIIGVKAKEGLSTYLNIVENNRFYRPGCSYCPIRDFCMQGCFGAQYEATGEVFQNIPSVCRFLERYYDFLIFKYRESGIIDYVLDPTFIHYDPYLANSLKEYFKDKEDKIKHGKN